MYLIEKTGLLLGKGLKIAARSIGHSVQPLEGVRVLDLTRIVAGPYCTMILGDLGAEVIKIEKPGVGDETRNYAPPYVNNTSETCYFASLNRNKRSVCINIQHKKGREILYELAKKADVLVENYVPGKLDELELGYEHFKQCAPHLVYCSITGYGQRGPYKSKPGYDVVAASIGGLVHITGPEDGEPAKVGVAITDISTGLYAHGAILAALLQRNKTGLGQKIDCDLLSVQASCLINIGSNYLNAGKEATRQGTAHTSIVPYQAFKTKDGYFTVGVGSDKQFKSFCKILERPELANDAKFLTNKDRVTNRIELLKILKDIFTKRTNSEWQVVLDDAPFPCGPVNSIKAVFDDPHIKEIDLVKEVEHPIAGKIKLVGPPVQYSEGGNFLKLPPPTLGQHTFEVLQDVLNYSPEAILQLKSEQVVQ